MKKLWFFALFYLSFFVLCNSVHADTGDYTTYSVIKLSKGSLLEEFTDQQIEEYQKKCNKRKWMGWRTYTVNNKVQATFISDTIYSFYNDGPSKIDYELTTVASCNTKTAISATGSLSYSLKGDIKKFKNGLDSALKMEGSYNKISEVKETEKISLDVDPYTEVKIYMTGNAKVTNGYAKRYVWWIGCESGGFEYFTITNLYTRIEKKEL